MRNVTKILAASGLIVLSFGLAGCEEVAQAPQKAPEVVLQEGLAKLSNMTSYKFDVVLKGDLKGPDGQPPAKVTVDATLNGGIDTKDTKDPRLNLNLKGNMMADADGGTGELSFRMNKDNLYLNLKSLEGKGSITVPEEIKSQLIGKWWTMPVPPEALAEMAKSMPQGADATLTDEQKQMKTLIEQTKFFKDVKFVDMAPVAGEQSYHYTGVLDKTAFSAFVVKASELQGQTVSEEEKTQMKTSMDTFDFSGDFYVGKDSGALNKVKGTLTIKENADKSSPSGTLSLDVTVSDLNKAVTVEVPADAQPIPAEALSSLPL
jgi:hypothetical protein